jgi:hypothetical protein
MVNNLLKKYDNNESLSTTIIKQNITKIFMEDMRANIEKM